MNTPSYHFESDFPAELGELRAEALAAPVDLGGFCKGACELIRKDQLSTSVLDVGCGTGVLGLELTHTESTLSYLGIDVSTDYIGIACRSANAMARRCDYRVCDARSFLQDPENHRAYDTVVGLAVNEIFDNAVHLFCALQCAARRRIILGWSSEHDLALSEFDAVAAASRRSSFAMVHVDKQAIIWRFEDCRSRYEAFYQSDLQKTLTRRERALLDDWLTKRLLHLQRLDGKSAISFLLSLERCPGGSWGGKAC